MGNRKLTQDEQKRIIEKIKAHLDDVRHSNCGVGRMVKEVIGEYVDAYETNAIANLIVAGKKYLKTRDSIDWTITINPEYVEPKFSWWKVLERVGIVGGIIGGVVGIFFIYDRYFSESDTSKETESPKTELQLKSPSNKDSVETNSKADSSKTN